MLRTAAMLLVISTLLPLEMVLLISNVWFWNFISGTEILNTSSDCPQMNARTSQWWKVSTGSGNNRQQAITWTNDETVPCRIYASRGLKEEPFSCSTSYFKWFKMFCYHSKCIITHQFFPKPRSSYWIQIKSIMNTMSTNALDSLYQKVIKWTQEDHQRNTVKYLI